MKVKICGIKDLYSAKVAIEEGADAIGFVFAKSNRQITVKEAKEIVSFIPKHISKIGVFVNETKEVLESIYEEVGLSHIQLHGDETPEFCQTIQYPLIKAFRIETENDLNTLSSYDCDYFLLDSPFGKYRGGNGTTFDWSLLLNKEVPREKLILAGGLTADNVLKASQIVKPFMVDVSSGVETNGVKDPVKIQSFIKKVKGGI